MKCFEREYFGDAETVANLSRYRKFVLEESHHTDRIPQTCTCSSMWNY